MSTLTGPGSTGSVPRPGDPASPDLHRLGTVTAAIQRANHVTSFASWLLATTTLGLVFELEARRLSGPALAWLLPATALVLGPAAHAVRLLLRAAAATTVIGGLPRWSAGASTDEPPTAEQVWDRLHLATAAVQHRDLLARRALSWAYVSGALFLCWTVLAALGSRGHLPGG